MVMGTVRAVIRAAGSSAALVALVVGVPWLLATLAGWPLPTTSPDWSAVWLDIRQLNLDGRWVVGVLAVAAWVLWGQVIWSLLFEAWNMVRAGRGLTPRSAPFAIPTVSLLVSKLVAGVISVTLATTSPASAAAVSSALPVHSAEPTQPFETNDEFEIASERQETESEPVSESTVTVGEAETAWDVAIRVFGEGHRVDELLSHNQVSALDVVPGTVLRLPPGVTAPDSVSVPAEAEVTVADGDHFWDLARRHLAESWGREPTNAEVTPYWADMVELNSDRLLPPGDADLIYPGQDLIYPPVTAVPDVSEIEITSAAAPSTSAGTLESTTDSAPSNAPVPSANAPSGRSMTTAPVTALTTSANTASTAAPATPTSTTLTPTSATTASSSTPASPNSVAGSSAGSGQGDGRLDGDSEEGSDADHPIGMVTVTGLGLLTAAIGAIIARSQARRIGGRQPGTAPRFDVPAAAETLISTTADHDALSDLDRTLRYMGARLHADDLAVPDLVGVLINSDDIRLLLPTPHRKAPEPFVVERDGMVWSIDRPVPLFDVAGCLNPYPTLVSVGYTEAAQLLVDIEYIGSVSLQGGFADVVDTMAAIALQLATSPMADTIDIVCVGFSCFGSRLASLQDASRFVAAVNRWCRLSPQPPANGFQSLRLGGNEKLK